MSTLIEETTDNDTDKESGGRRMDPEIKAIGAIIRILDDIDEPARSRVVAYLTARYVK